MLSFTKEKGTELRICLQTKLGFVAKFMLPMIKSPKMSELLKAYFTNASQIFAVIFTWRKGYLVLFEVCLSTKALHDLTCSRLRTDIFFSRWI